MQVIDIIVHIDNSGKSIKPEIDESKISNTTQFIEMIKKDRKIQMQNHI